MKVALDERAAVAILVDDASDKSCRPPASSGSPAGIVGARRVHIDQLAAACSAYSFEISSADGQLVEAGSA